MTSRKMIIARVADRCSPSGAAAAARDTALLPGREHQVGQRVAAVLVGAEGLNQVEHLQRCHRDRHQHDDRGSAGSTG